MAVKFTSRLRGEQGICIANLILSLTLLIISGTKNFLEGEAAAGWLLYGCGVLLIAAFLLIGKLKGGITPKALLSALCQPPLILYLMGGRELLSLTYFFLSADLVLTGAYFCFWISLPQFLFSDLMVLLHILWDMSGNNTPFTVPFILLQFVGLVTLLIVWRGSFYRKQSHLLSEEFDGLLDMFGDLYNHLQQGFDRTLVRLEQISEQDGLLLECSSCLGAASEPVFSGVQRSVQILEKLQNRVQEFQNAADLEKRMAILFNPQLRETYRQLQSAQAALEEYKRMIAQILGVIHNYQGDVRAIQQDTRSLGRLAQQTYSLLRVQKDAIHPAR